MNDSAFSSTRRRVAVLLASLVGIGPVMAVDVDDLNVTKEGRTYEVQMTFTVAASADEVIAVLTDYTHPARLNPEVKSQVVISEIDGVTRVRTERRSCLFLFCRDIEMTQDVTVVGGLVRADIVPGEGHFRSGSMQWSVSRIGDTSARIEFAAIMEPDVFVPPLFGRYLVRKMLLQEVLTTAENLELAAAGEPLPDMP